MVVTLNLFLTVKLMKAMRWQVMPDTLKEPLPIGSTVENFEAFNEDTNQKKNLSESGSAKVFVFLHTGCPSCKERIPDAEKALKLSESEGVDIYLITTESYKRCRAFLKGTDLLPHLLQVDESVYERINPQKASPAYVFVNDLNVVEAEGIIGDENWLGFIEQLALLKDEMADE
jgi:peroxiredoxin